MTDVHEGLYTEGITYSAFAAPRAHNYSTYMYRVRPAAAHSKSCRQRFLDLANTDQMATQKSSQKPTLTIASFP